MRTLCKSVHPTCWQTVYAVSMKTNADKQKSKGPICSFLH